MVKQANYNMKTVADCINDKSPYDETILEKIKNVKDPVFQSGNRTTSNQIPNQPQPSAIPTQSKVSSAQTLTMSLWLVLINYF
jgi:hypothetical protein